MTPIPPPAPQKPARSGCATALLVIGGLLALLCLVSAVGLLIAARSETGAKLFSAFNQGMTLATKGLDAQGTAELRAAGCTQAMVVDMKETAKLAELFMDGGFGDTADMDYLDVTCSMDLSGTPPDCDTLAPIYAKAAPSEREFVLDVRVQGRNKPTCRARYAGDGEKIGDEK